MRIAHLIDDLGCGGAEQVVAGLSSHHSRLGHLIRVVCLRNIGPYAINTGALLEAGVEITTLNKPPGFHFGTLRELTSILKGQGIEVVHTHNHLVHHYGALAARYAGVPAVVNTLHGSASLRMSSWRAKALFLVSCVMTDRIVFVCKQVDASIQRSFCVPSRKRRIVENGIDLSRFLSISRHPNDGTVTFGNIGRLDLIKDHESLIRAFALLKKRNPNVQLKILGHGNLMNSLKELANSLSIASDVHFEGFSLDTPSFLKNIDIYVIASRSEGLPLTLLEAMGAALPVVATAVGEVPHILLKARSGWLCPPSDPNELARAMERALLAPDLATFGAQSRKAVENHYSIERMGREYEQLYDEVLSGKKI